MTFDPMSVGVTCVTLPKDHCVQVPQKYIRVCGYSDPFSKNLNQTSLNPRWPLTPCLLRSHMWLYPRIIVSKSHGNTSMYVDTVINFAKSYILQTYYVQNEWSQSLTEHSSGEAINFSNWAFQIVQKSTILTTTCRVQITLSFDEIHYLGWVSLFGLLSSSKWVNFITAYDCLNPAYRYECDCTIRKAQFDKVCSFQEWNTNMGTWHKALVKCQNRSTYFFTLSKNHTAVLM